MSKLNILFSSNSMDDFFNPRKFDDPKNIKYRVSSLSQLSGFQFISDDKLIRVSKNDFWRLGEDGDGYFIECLVDDSNGPVREG